MTYVGNWSKKNWSYYYRDVLKCHKDREEIKKLLEIIMNWFER